MEGVPAAGVLCWREVVEVDVARCIVVGFDVVDEEEAATELSRDGTSPIDGDSSLGSLTLSLRFGTPGPLSPAMQILRALWRTTCSGREKSCPLQNASL